MKAESDILQHRGVKPTPNRLLVLHALLQTESPLSLSDLEEELTTMDRSSIFRVLTLFAETDIAHLIESGDGIQRYEACHGNDGCTMADRHIHFYCTRCHRTYCFDSIPVPQVEFPEGFTIRSANYLARGICPRCR